MSSPDDFSWFTYDDYDTPEERERHLRTCNQLYLHADDCPEPNCPLDKCQSMKTLIEHVKNCDECCCKLCKTMIRISRVCPNPNQDFATILKKVKKLKMIQRNNVFKRVLTGRIDRSPFKYQGLLIQGLTEELVRKRIAESGISGSVNCPGLSVNKDSGKQDDDWHEEIKIVTNVSEGAEVIKTYRVPSIKFLLNRRRVALMKLTGVTNPPVHQRISFDQSRFIQSNSSGTSTVNDQEKLLDGMAAMNIDEPETNQVSTIDQ